MRLDKFLTLRMQHCSRNRIQTAVDSGSVLVGGRPAKSSYKVKPLDRITVVMPYPKREVEIVPQNIPLDIPYEDDDLLIVDKPAGMVVHPGHGNWDGTLVNALTYHLRTLPMFREGDLRAGLVHRIDKDTSGLLVVAKNERAHARLAKQFFDHTIVRRYYALVWGNPDADEQRRAGVDAALADHVEDELHDRFVAFDGHQDLGRARKRAAAARHVGVDHGVGRIRNDFKIDPGDAVAGVVARVLFVEDLHGVVTQGSRNRRAAHGLLEARFELVANGKIGTEFDVILNDARILAERNVACFGHVEIGKHGIVNKLGEFALLNAPHGFELFENVVGKALAEEGRELRHDVREALGELSLVGHGESPWGRG